MPCTRSAYMRIIEDFALYCLLPDPNEGFVDQIESSASSRGNVLNWAARLRRPILVTAMCQVCRAVSPGAATFVSTTFRTWSFQNRNCAAPTRSPASA
jgi:hypothetical protein